VGTGDTSENGISFVMSSLFGSHFFTGSSPQWQIIIRFKMKLEKLHSVEATKEGASVLPD
jgi:hypothetical protein